jgi:hypothetical protein
LAITPWTWRNYRVTGKIIPVVGNSGFAYFAGNAHWGITKPARQPNETMEESEFRHIGLPPENASTLIEYRGFTEIAPEELTNKRAKEDLKAYPLRFGKKVTLNAFEYHFPLLYYLIPPSGTEPSTHRFVERMLTMQEKLLIPISLINVALVGAALCALYSLFRSNQRFPALFLASVWAAYACPYFPFLTAVNHNLYLFGVLPTLSILAAVFVLKPKMLAHSERVLAQDFSLDSK